MSPHHVDWRTLDTCVLDMDGTLLDLHFDNQVWNERLPLRYAERAGLAHDAAQAHVSATLARAHGSLNWYCLEHWSREFGLDMSAIEGELESLIRVRPGVIAFLDFLRGRGIRLVLATNAHPVSLERKLAVTGIAPHFDVIVSAHQFGHAKEHDGFWPCLEQHCELPRERTLFIDDNPAVLAAARRFGIRYLFGVARPDSRRGRAAQPGFHSLEDFGELTSAA